MHRNEDRFIFDRFDILESFSSSRNCISLSRRPVSRAFAMLLGLATRDERKNLRREFFFARALILFASGLMIVVRCCRMRKYHRARVSGRERQVCRGIMKYAEKICEADISNVTRSVPSFYANKSGGRLISPRCSDAAVAIAVVNIGVGAGDDIGVGVDGQDDLTSAGDTIPVRVYGTPSPVETHICIDDG